MLDGYIECDKSKWNSVKCSRHVRYFRSDGSFCGGGYVIANPVISDKNDTTYMRLKFQPGRKKCTEWMLDYNKISRLFVRTSAEYEHFEKVYAMKVSGRIA